MLGELVTDADDDGRLPGLDVEVGCPAGCEGRIGNPK